MATITTINGSDNISTSDTVINDNFANLNSDKIETSVLDTDTSLAANSDSKIATQKAVKAYVDVGGNTNASETTRGIVEEATDAEVTAGTATGATGAKLIVTPTKLLTYLATVLLFVKKLVTAGATTTIDDGTADEKTILTVSVPGGTLSTNNGVRGVIYVSNLSGNDTPSDPVFKLKYGSTTLVTTTLNSGGSFNDHKGKVEFALLANASASAQKGILELDFSADQLDPFVTTAVKYARSIAFGTATETSSGALNLVLTIQFGDASADNDFVIEGYIVETIK